MPLVCSIKIEVRIAFTTNHFVFQIFSSQNPSMSVKKRVHSFSKLNLIFEEVPECFMDETDVETYFSTTFVTLVNLITGKFE